MIDDGQMTIHKAYQLLKKKEVSSVELTKASLARIKKMEPDVKAIVIVTGELALKQAQ